ELHGLNLHEVQHTPGNLTGQLGDRMGPESYVKAGAGQHRLRRALRACTASVVKKPVTDAAATPSQGAAQRGPAPGARPTPPAASPRPLNFLANCQAGRAMPFTPAAFPTR